MNNLSELLDDDTIWIGKNVTLKVNPLKLPEDVKLVPCHIHPDDDNSDLDKPQTICLCQQT